MSLNSGRTVLVVAAHPDDEVLGCGGTIARHVREGDEVHVVICAEGVTSRDGSRDAEGRREELNTLRSAAECANELLGARTVTFHGLPDNRLDSIDLLDIIKLVESAVSDRKPSIVYTHHAGDLNVDHRCVHMAVASACRPQPGHSVRTLLFFEVASSTEWQAGNEPHFTPNWFVDVTETLDLKLQALKAYSGELRGWPHPRSLEAVGHLARWRGATAGVEACEAFMLGRLLG